MSSNNSPVVRDLFPRQTAHCPTTVTLYLKRLQAPRIQGNEGKERKQNYHVPSFKNSKRWITKDPRGNPLKRPFLITSPEFQQWMERAAQLLESQLLSMSQTTCDGIPQVPLKLSAILSCIPPDDSVRELKEGSWTVEKVAPGEEGAKIVIERLS